MFKCSHPQTPENTYSWKTKKRNAAGMTVCYGQAECKTCRTARNASRSKKGARRWGPMDREVARAKDAALLAQGRCKVCDLMLPCGSSHSVVELAENRLAITMPEGGL